MNIHGATSKSARRSTKPGDAENEAKTVFITNVSGLTVPDIKEFFKSCQPVSVSLKQSYGFVEFSSRKMAELATKLNQSVYKGKRIGVIIADEAKRSGRR